jgi:hypothetical protein
MEEPKQRSKYAPIKKPVYLKDHLKYVGTSLATSLDKNVKSLYYIEVESLDKLKTRLREHDSQEYWKTFKLTQNLFYTDLNIKHIKMIQIKPHSLVEKCILKYDR